MPLLISRKLFGSFSSGLILCSQAKASLLMLRLVGSHGFAASAAALAMRSIFAASLALASAAFCSGDLLASEMVESRIPAVRTPISVGMILIFMVFEVGKRKAPGVGLCGSDAVADFVVDHGGQFEGAGFGLEGSGVCRLLQEVSQVVQKDFGAEGLAAFGVQKFMVFE